MNTLGPICPKCQKALRYSFAFRFFNPYNFACPNCGARLRANKGSTLYLSGCAILGALLGVTAAWSHDTGRLTLMDTILLFTFIGLAASFVWHLYIWKTDKLSAKHDA
jgi:hypothetical protein